MWLVDVKRTRLDERTGQCLITAGVRSSKELSKKNLKFISDSLSSDVYIHMVLVNKYK